MTLKILVVDDEPDLLSEALPVYGYDIKVCTNGHDALRILNTEKESICLIILDINMPIMDGWTCLKKIRENDDFELIPIIMLTGIKGEEKEIIGLRQGADDYISKPIRLPQLLARIEALLKRYNIEPQKEQIKDDTSQVEPLSAREKEILKLLISGVNNNQIAQELFIDEDTVKAHLKKIYKKLNVSNRAQAAFYAIEHNLID